MKKYILSILVIFLLNSWSPMDVINVGAGIYGGIEKDNK